MFPLAVFASYLETHFPKIPFFKPKLLSLFAVLFFCCCFVSCFDFSCLCYLCVFLFCFWFFWLRLLFWFQIMIRNIVYSAIRVFSVQCRLKGCLFFFWCMSLLLVFLVVGFKKVKFYAENTLKIMVPAKIKQPKNDVAQHAGTSFWSVRLVKFKHCLGPFLKISFSLQKERFFDQFLTYKKANLGPIFDCTASYVYVCICICICICIYIHIL